jgi:hypothetical protein
MPGSNSKRRHGRPRPTLSDEKRLRQRRWQVGMGVLLLVLLVGTPLVVLACVGVFDGVFVSRVNPENFELLQVGMKEAQVIKILGQPSEIDSRAVPRLRGPVSSRYDIKPHQYPRRFYWYNGEDVIWVDVLNRRVKRFGATLDGEMVGPDPMTTKVTDPDPPAETEGE